MAPTEPVVAARAIAIVRRANNGGRLIVVSEPGASGEIEIRVGLSHIALVALMDLSVVVSEPNIRIMNADQMSRGAGTSLLQQWRGTSPARYQFIVLRPELVSACAATIDVSAVPGVSMSTDPVSAGVTRYDAASEAGWIMQPSGAGRATITGHFGNAADSAMATTEVLAVDDPGTQVAQLFDFTMADIVSVAGQPVAGADLEVGFDNGQIVSWGATVLPSLVTFTPADATAMQVLADGRLVPLKNVDAMALTATVGSIQVETTFSIDLEPAIGDIDIDRSALLSAARPGSPFSIPVYINSGSQAVGAYEFSFTFDPAVIALTSIDAGGGEMSFRMSEYNHSVLIAGTGHRELTGARALAVTMWFVAVSERATLILGTVNRIVDVDGSTVGADGPRVSPAAACTLRIGRAARASASPLRPPLELRRTDPSSCSGETLPGDVDGDCELSIADLNAIQRMVLEAQSSGGVSNRSAATYDVDGNGVHEQQDVTHAVKSHLGLLDLPKLTLVPSSCLLGMPIVMYPSGVLPLSAACYTAGRCPSRMYVGMYSTEHSFQATFNAATFNNAVVLQRGPQGYGWPYFGGFLLLDAAPEGQTRLQFEWDDAPTLRDVHLFMYQEGGSSEGEGQWYFGSQSSANSDRLAGNFVFISMVHGIQASFQNQAGYRVLNLDRTCQPTTTRAPYTEALETTVGTDLSAVGAASDGMSDQQITIVALVGAVLGVVGFIILFYWCARTEAKDSQTIVTNGVYVPDTVREGILEHAGTFGTPARGQVYGNALDLSGHAAGQRMSVVASPGFGAVTMRDMGGRPSSTPFSAPISMYQMQQETEF